MEVEDIKFTEAVHAALKARGIEPPDEVVMVPPMLGPAKYKEPEKIKIVWHGEKLDSATKTPRALKDAGLNYMHPSAVVTDTTIAIIDEGRAQPRIELTVPRITREKHQKLFDQMEKRVKTYTIGENGESVVTETIVPAADDGVEDIGAEIMGINQSDDAEPSNSELDA